MKTELQKARAEIDALDDQLLDILKRRAELAVKVKSLKSGTVYKPAREAEILQRVTAANHGPLPGEAVAAIFQEIISSCRNLEAPLRIAYLGPEGTYSHEAAIALFGKTSLGHPEISLTQVLLAAENGSTDVALLPCENSSEGAVSETHRILLKTDLKIIREYTMPIRHALLSTCHKVEDIKTVYSHPQSLGQCREWLQHHIPEASLVSANSNSEAVLKAADDSNAAAVASARTSVLYGVPILADNIQDNPDNRTRFIVVGREEADPTGKDKTSIICSVNDKPGALHELLGLFAEQNITLTRLESRPTSNNSYLFYIDFKGHKNDPIVASVLKKLAVTARSCKILGSYPEG